MKWETKKRTSKGQLTTASVIPAEAPAAKYLQNVSLPSFVAYSFRKYSFVENFTARLGPSENMGATIPL